MNNSTESLPPPPAFLLDSIRQTQSTPTTPPSVIPSSSLKVAETVKALSAIRHQPASPNALRRIQQHQQQQQHHNQQQHQHQQPTLQSPNQRSLGGVITCNESDYESYYNPYVELNAYGTTPSSALPAAMTFAVGSKLQTAHQQQPRLQQPLTALSPPEQSEVPPPLPPPNPQHPSHNYNHQHHLHTQQQQPQSCSQNQPRERQQPQEGQIHQHQLQQQNHHHHGHAHHVLSLQQQQQEQLNNSNASYDDSPSFRTSSPGIYAQPKIVNNMSSFRSASPGPNGVQHHPHQVPPNQPKTNPNLIAQLNARLNKQQQQHQQSGSEGAYGSTPNSPNHHHHLYQQQQQQQQHQQQNEAIYTRNYTQQQQQMPPQQQQQHYDDYASTNIEKAGSIRSKTKAEFLENLNAKLAKQNMSGRAFAVRNLINSKALPDPRLCHESLMDQIKRGATLKRNQKINDRSAPKIH